MYRQKLKLMNGTNGFLGIDFTTRRRCRPHQVWWEKIAGWFRPWVLARPGFLPQIQGVCSEIDEEKFRSTSVDHEFSMFFFTVPFDDSSNLRNFWFWHLFRHQFSHQSQINGFLVHQENQAVCWEGSWRARQGLKGLWKSWPWFGGGCLSFKTLYVCF